MGFFDNGCTDLNSMVFGRVERGRKDGNRGFVILIPVCFGSDWTFYKM